MRPPLRFFSALLFFGLFLLPFTAHADPFVITSGTITRIGPNGISETNYSLAGPDISIAHGNTLEAFDICNPCLGGQTNTLRFSMDPGGGGPTTINGVTFPVMGFNGVFNATTSSFFLPPGDLSTPDVTLTIPFTFTGRVIGCRDIRINCTDRAFEADLIGEGFAVAHFRLFSVFPPVGNSYVLRDITFNFQPAAATVPEPATLLLLGTGLAGVAARVRRRRKVSK